jgi:NSS family neurotransmitter:Na+ symporter
VIRDRWGWSRTKAASTVCVVTFLIGILYTTSAGLYWVDIVDRAVAFYAMLITGILACIIVGWVFGAEKLRAHLNEFSDIKIGKWFDWSVKVVAPASLTFVVVYGGSVKDLINPYGSPEYPLWASSMIWVILIATLVLSFVFQFFNP